MMRLCVWSVCVMVLILGSTVSAQSNEWSWKFVAIPNSQDSATIGWFGVNSQAQDGYDAQDGLAQPVAKAYLGTYHVNGESGWIGPTGHYNLDTRAVLQQQIGGSQSWLFYVWADTSLATSVEEIALTWYCALPRLAPHEDIEFRLTLTSKPMAITGGPPVGTSWMLSSRPQGVIFLPTYRTTNGLDGYTFEFTATVIPEPSSLLALATGVVPLAGRVRRRL